MSWLDRLRGRELPPRASAPNAEVPGATRKGVKEGVWIEKGDQEFRQGLLECIYRDGVRQGPYRFWKGHLSERGSFFAGKQHGLARAWKADGTLDYEREYRDGRRWAGCFDTRSIDGKIHERQSYANGKPIGAWEEYDGGGRPILRWSYDDQGRLHGPWSIFHAARSQWRKDGLVAEGGEPKLLGQYQHGARTGSWRWLRIDGSIAAECDFTGDGAWRAGGAVIAPADDDDLARWVLLAEAFKQFSSSGEWFRVEEAIGAWPEERQPVEWLAARIAECDNLPRLLARSRRWLKVGSGDDPVIDGLSIDHDRWNAEDVARLVARAGRMRELHLHEVELDVDALFKRAAWPKLEVLSLADCGTPARLVRALAKADWTGALITLQLDDPIADRDAAALMMSPHLGALRRLKLGRIGPGKSLTRALASTPLLDQLEDLELQVDGEVDELVATLAARPTPRLRRLHLAGDGAPPRERLIQLAGHPALESLFLEVERAPRGIAGEIAALRPSLRFEIRPGLNTPIENARF